MPRLGLGLAIIRDGDLKAGREQIEIAVALDPTNSLTRSYVGKAYYEENTKARPARRHPIGPLTTDPKDLTPWFYDAVRQSEQPTSKAFRAATIHRPQRLACRDPLALAA
jgi:hypothetical protein